jgi:glucose dehydrogenase
MPVFQSVRILPAAILLSLPGLTLPTRAGEAGAGARENLPPFQVIPAAKPEELTRANGWPASGNGANWERSLGGPTSNRFSELRQITPQNVSRLEVAWTYRSGDGAGNIQCNPIVVDGTLYTNATPPKVKA